MVVDIIITGENVHFPEYLAVIFVFNQMSKLEAKKFFWSQVCTYLIVEQHKYASCKNVFLSKMFWREMRNAYIISVSRRGDGKRLEIAIELILNY